MIPIQQRLGIDSAPVILALRQFECDLRVAIPGIVTAFDATRQVVSVQPAIQEVMRRNAVPTITTLPILDDVPICIPRAGGWSLTLPIAVGDECLLVFSDMGIDHWWQSGGIQKQPDGKLYRHDIGDAVAIFGITSQPKVLANYSTSSAQLRSDDGSVVVDMATGKITLNAASVEVVSGAGIAQPLMNQTFLTWFTADILPFLISKGYAGPTVPIGSATTILEGE